MFYLKTKNITIIISLLIYNIYKWLKFNINFHITFKKSDKTLSNIGYLILFYLLKLSLFIR